MSLEPNNNPDTSDLEVVEVVLGESMVTVAIFPSNYFSNDPSSREVMAEVERRKLQDPEKDIMNTLLDSRSPAEFVESPLVGIFDIVQGPITRGGRVVNCTVQDGDGRKNGQNYLMARWLRNCRFAAVVSKRPLWS
ncbi:MAG: hypothetical protein KIH62_001575 [Candidatus Kerfeldbacteria bacterium]|nr:hypothetical protein [Candidatus Kerfeldbacteria bacterium]